MKRPFFTYGFGRFMGGSIKTGAGGSCGCPRFKSVNAVDIEIQFPCNVEFGLNSLGTAWHGCHLTDLQILSDFGHDDGVCQVRHGNF